MRERFADAKRATAYAMARNHMGAPAVRLRGWHWPMTRSDRFRPENRYSASKAHVTRDTSDSQESAETSNCSAGRPSHTARSRASARRDSNAGKSSFTGSSTPATTAAAWPAESSQRTISAKYTPLPVESGFCAEIFRMRIRATSPSNSNHHTVTQRKAAQADRASHRQAREKPKAQRFTKICPHASAMQGMIEP